MRGTKREALLPPFFILRSTGTFPQPPRRMREQGVDHARLRGQVAAQYRGCPFVARDFVQQALELGDVAVDGLLEIAGGAVCAADFLQRLVAGGRVEPLATGLALVALLAVPHLR